MRQTCFALLIAWSAAVEASEGPPAPTEEQLQFFETKIRPVLVGQCYECHAAGAKILKGGLRLDHRAGLLQGGDSGPAVVPGKPAESLLLKALRHDGFEMPPRGKLPEAVIRDFETWIAQGAPDPRIEKTTAPSGNAAAVAAGSDHWAFQPPRRHAPPPVNDLEWPWSDVDYFLLARLEQHHLRPAPDADRRTWLRRVTIDLTGLVPTPEELEAFLSDRSSAAHARVVDRLLSSESFGDRWGRHWLDLAQYADTISVDRLFPDREAWRYRDYVISAFNSDKPFDQFLTEQIAGDLLPAASSEQRLAQMVATAFLMQGPTQVINQFKDQLRWDVVDNQVQKVSLVFCGLTMQCARCHDHKFDPLSQHDYYALAGILQNVQVIDGFLGNSKVFSNVKWSPLPVTPSEEARLAAEQPKFDAQKTVVETELARIDLELSAAKKTVADLKAASASAAASEAAKADSTADSLPAAAELTAAEKQVASLTARQTAKKNELSNLTLANAPQKPLAFVATEPAQVTNARITIRGNASQLGDEVPRGFIQACTLAPPPQLPEDASGRRELAQWLTDDSHPLTARVIVNRVWKHVFGEGLVRSVDNFGVRGDAPSHPELLDDLAVRFREDGWSVKRLIRSLALSHAYRMSSEHHAAAHEVDPNNRLLWRMHRRRNEAEVIRDTMLQISGQLDSGRGGPALPPANWVPGKISMYAMISGEPPPPEPVANRRTVYLPVYRRSPAWAAGQVLFGQADPKVVTGARSMTTVPTQALYLLNSEFVIGQARLTARRLLAQSEWSDVQRVEHLISTSFSRPPREDERQRLLAFVAQVQADGQSAEAAWTELCQAVLAANEFLMRL